MITLSPTIQDLTLEDESVVPFQITVKNSTMSTVKMNIVAVDFEQIDDAGNIAFVNTASHNQTLAKYIEIDTPIIEISPKNEVSIQAKILNSDDLTVGGHYAAILLTEVTGDNSLDSTVQMGISSLVFLHKTGGEKYDLQLSQISITDKGLQFFIPKTVTMHFTNNGNIQTIPTGTVQWVDMFGNVTHEALINHGSQYVLPTKNKVFSTQLQSRTSTLPVMKYRVIVHGDNNVHTTPFHTELTVYVCNPFFITVLVVGFLMSVFFIAVLRRKHLRKKEPK